jgi:hypothetical protein
MASEKNVSDPLLNKQEGAAQACLPLGLCGGAAANTTCSSDQVGRHGNVLAATRPGRLLILVRQSEEMQQEAIEVGEFSLPIWRPETLNNMQHNKPWSSSASRKYVK